MRQQHLIRYWRQLALCLVLPCLLYFVYIVSSLSGAFQRTPTSISSNKKTTAAANDPIISTYEDESGQNADGRTKVPELLGMSITEATKALKEAGLKIVLARTYEYSDEYATGLVCRQQYDKGTVVDKGSTIKVYLSLGSDKFEINGKLYVNGNVSILKYYLRSFKDIDGMLANTVRNMQKIWCFAWSRIKDIFRREIL